MQTTTKRLRQIYRRKKRFETNGKPKMVRDIWWNREHQQSVGVAEFADFTPEIERLLLGFFLFLLVSRHRNIKNNNPILREITNKINIWYHTYKQNQTTNKKFYYSFLRLITGTVLVWYIICSTMIIVLPYRGTVCCVSIIRLADCSFNIPFYHYCVSS